MNSNQLRDMGRMKQEDVERQVEALNQYLSKFEAGTEECMQEFHRWLDSKDFEPEDKVEIVIAFAFSKMKPKTIPGVLCFAQPGIFEE